MGESSRYPAGRRLANVILAAMFVGGISAPFVRQVTARVGSDAATRELRAPRNLPRLRSTRMSVRSFPSRFEAWYADEFGFRGELVRWHHILRWFGFGVSPTDKVVLGKEGWLFYAEDEAIPVFRGAAPFTEVELAGWQHLLETRRELLALGGISYIFAIAPSKSRIYPEFMPERFDRIGPTRLDQLSAWLAAHSQLEVLDLRPALVAAKVGDAPGDWLYNRLGTHWNARGSLVAYREITMALAAAVRGLRPWRDADFVMLPRGASSDSWGDRMYMEDLLFEEERSLALRDPPRVERLPDLVDVGGVRVALTLGPDPEAPKALFFHDSYLPGILPILATHFSAAIFSWGAPFTVERVRAFRPDVVVEVYVDRCLVSQSPFALLPMAQGPLRQEFSASQATRYSGGTGHWGLAPYQGAKLAIEGEWLEVIIPAGGGVLLPVLRGPSGERRILRMQVVAPAATTLELMYLTQRRPAYNRTDLIQFPLARGFNELFLELADPTLEGRVLVRPGRVAGRYVIMELTVRGAPR